jgi:predicted metal-dependent enzyme (double-stranded beta helix superfamily)
VSFCTAIEEALSGLQMLSADDRSAHLVALKSYLKADSPVFDELRKISVADTTKPYGRRVLLDTDELEVMVAQWTRDMPCAPHDHGGSLGVVRVLQGRSRHQIWTVDDQGLRSVRKETVAAGETMMCGSDLIHSMEDDGAEDPLITLHMYTRSIDHMIVYDTEQHETLVVDGTCGAWVPADSPEMIRCRKVGFHHPNTMR